MVRDMDAQNVTSDDQLWENVCGIWDVLTGSLAWPAPGDALQSDVVIVETLTHCLAALIELNPIQGDSI